MAKVRIYFDRKGNTLNVWFDDPLKEDICEETGDEVILVKDKKGKVIGFEKLNFILPSELRKKKEIHIPLEVMMA